MQIEEWFLKISYKEMKTPLSNEQNIILIKSAPRSFSGMFSQKIVICKKHIHFSVGG